MNKRITALALAAVSAPLLAVTGATAASAAPACGAYPAGQPFQLRISPTYALVNRGSVINLSTRLVRGGENCADQRVGFYLRGRGKSQYVLTQNANPVTDALGLRDIDVTVRDDFRYFSNYSNATTLFARSRTGLVQVRR